MRDGGKEEEQIEISRVFHVERAAREADMETQRASDSSYVHVSGVYILG